MAENKKQEVAISRNARRRRKLKDTRAQNNKDGNFPGFQKYLEEKKNNRFYGMNPEDIVKSENFKTEVSKIVKQANEHGMGDPKSNEYKTALAKVQKMMAKQHPSLGDLSLTTFTKVLDVDDLGTLARGIGTAAYHVYQKPEVKAFVHEMANKGIMKVRDLFQARSDNRTGAGSHQATAVNLGYIMGAMTNVCPPISSPNDLPRSVYTNKFCRSYTFDGSLNGTGVWCINPNNIATIVSAQNTKTAFLAYDNKDSYDPNENSIPGNFGFVNSPLGESSALIDFLRVDGIEIKVVPTTSSLVNQGSFILGTLQGGMNDNRTQPIIETPVTYDQLSERIGFFNYDMKTTAFTRSFPFNYEEGRWMNNPSRDNTASPDQTFGLSYLMFNGGAAAATFNVTISITYSLIPTEAGVTLLRGKLPPMGPYTQRYVDFLRSQHPELCNMPAVRLKEFFDKLSSKGNLYEQLTG